jgi:hypothetical protein
MISLLSHPGPARLAAGLGVLALSGVLAACGSSTPPTPAPSSTATSATSATPTPAERVVAGCQALSGWSSTDAVTTKIISSDLAGTRTGADFATLLRANANGDAATSSATAQALTSDCEAAGVAVSLTITVTDPNGKTCSSLDSSGYCPGDSPSPSPSPTPSPTMTRQVDLVVFKVWGSGYPSVQYGSDSNNNDAPGGYGPLGNGVALPWSASLTYGSSALYYAVSAQLQGYGDIADSVTEVITTYCSDGSHKTESFPLASGHASGGYAIAQAEYAGGDTGNATQGESDAGC